MKMKNKLSICLKFSLGSFGAFLNFDDLALRKRLVIEQNGLKFGPLG